MQFKQLDKALTDIDEALYIFIRALLRAKQACDTELNMLNLFDSEDIPDEVDQIETVKQALECYLSDTYKSVKPFYQCVSFLTGKCYKYMEHIYDGHHLNIY